MSVMSDHFIILYYKLLFCRFRLYIEIIESKNLIEYCMKHTNIFIIFTLYVTCKYKA